MLSLAAPTGSAWVECALQGLDEILVDHAHCERKAAGVAVQLMFRYTHCAFLHRPLAALAREELQHFQQVLDRLEAREVAFRPLRPGPYAARLREGARGTDPGLLVDSLLCSALIEARSCERFGLLAEGVDDAELGAFYRGLLACEARHHRVYVDLAARVAPAPEVRARLASLAEREAAVLREIPPLPRMHGGSGA